VIFQDFFRYHLPARDNIGLGKTDAIDDLDAVRRAAHQADADGFIAALARGYDTMLRRSSKEAPTSRSVSGSGWLWRARSSGTHPS
jgi:ATP-binding cassette subfamily B protein